MPHHIRTEAIRSVKRQFFKENPGGRARIFLKSRYAMVFDDERNTLFAFVRFMAVDGTLTPTFAVTWFF